jgi:hypothetical protein
MKDKENLENIINQIDDKTKDLISSYEAFKTLISIVVFLCLDVITIWFLWNYALVGAVDGIKTIGLFTSLCFVVLIKMIKYG